jgi:hypothetical protein
MSSRVVGPVEASGGPITASKIGDPPMPRFSLWLRRAARARTVPRDYACRGRTPAEFLHVRVAQQATHARFEAVDGERGAGQRVEQVLLHGDGVQQAPLRDAARSVEDQDQLDRDRASAAEAFEECEFLRLAVSSTSMLPASGSPRIASLNNVETHQHRVVSVRKTGSAWRLLRGPAVQNPRAGRPSAWAASTNRRRRGGALADGGRNAGGSKIVEIDHGVGAGP